MSGSPVKWCFNLLILVVLTLLPCTVSAETGETERGWPRLYGSDGNQVVVHQPQLEKWDDFLVLRGKAAVVVQLKNDKKKYYGALDFQASTAVDNEARTVFLHDFKITGQTYPNIDPKLAGNCRKAVEKALPAKGRLTISLDRVVAALERSRQQTREIEVNLEPPPIHYSNKPAVLVNFMGEPKFETVKGVSGLLFAVNTNWDVFLEVGSSRYYMLKGDGWLVTEDLAKGPWKPAGKLPKSFKKLPDNENWQEVKKNIPGKKVKKVPKIYVSMKPAELIVTDGAPEYTPISATKLLFVANTESDIFLYSPTSTHYFLVSGRWF